MKLFLLFLGELFEVLAADRLTFPNRDEGNARRGLKYTNILFFRLLLDLFERFFLDVLELFSYRLALSLEIFAFKGGWNGRLGILDHTFDIKPQFLAAARRQGKRPGLARFIEIRDIAPIHRHGAFGCFFVQKLPDKSMAARTGRPEHIDIVPVHANLGGEMDGFDGTLLAGNLFQFLQFSRGLEV